MTYEFFNDWHLGDCLFQCLYFHRLAPKFPNDEFVLRCRAEHHKQLAETVEHLPNVKLLPNDPAKRKENQQKIFDLRDKNHDGFWTKEEFTADMTVGQGRPNLAAIRPGGTGDITESHVGWNLRNGIPEIPSPVFYSGRLYLVRDGGTLSCVRASTGEVVYRERLGAAGQYMASPVIANDYLYLISAKGVLTVVKCGDKFEIVHQADLKAPISATPAMDQNSLYVRADDALMAFR